MRLALRVVGLLYVLSAAVVGALCWRAFALRARARSVGKARKPDNVIPFERRPPRAVSAGKIEPASRLR